MMNLFSSFNPITTKSTSMNWLMIMIPIMLMMTPYWKINSTASIPCKIIQMNISNQFKTAMNKINLPNMYIILSLMAMIMYLNMTSLNPFTFSPTSQLTVNMSLSMVLWMALTMNKLMTTKKFLSSLTPSMTPKPLIPFMVMIEMVSLMIQPMTLAIRLTANIMAGHIMLILLSQIYQLTIISPLLMNLLLMITEMGVSLIQAYVFSMLIVMYKK